MDIFSITKSPVGFKKREEKKNDLLIPEVRSQNSPFVGGKPKKKTLFIPRGLVFLYWEKEKPLKCSQIHGQNKKKKKGVVVVPKSLLLISRNSRQIERGGRFKKQPVVPLQTSHWRVVKRHKSSGDGGPRVLPNPRPSG